MKTKPIPQFCKALFVTFLVARQPLVGHGFLITEVSRSHSDTPQSVRLLWASDQSNVETSNLQRTIFTRERLPNLRRDSNRQFQEASYRRPTL